MKRIEDILRYVEGNHLYPDLQVIEGGAEPEVVIDGKKVLMFSSNSYLGLATHPKIITSAIEATKKYGVGAGGSRMLSGNLKIHRDYELAIAKFKGGEDAIVFSTGYQTNLGVITALMSPLKVGPYDFFRRRSVILSDELNHASIVDGAKASKQKVVVYKHCDMDDLEKKLKKFKHRRKLVVTDGVFSMEGDIAPLDKIATLCKKYNSLLMVDEAHATGVIGKNGHGTLEYFNLKPTVDVDIVMGTHSKALSSVGGFVVGSKNLIKYLRIASRPYIFSAALPPAVSASLITSLRVIESEPNLRILLNKKSGDLREKLNILGFDTLGSQTQIVPVLIGEDEQAIEFSRMLLDKGIYAPCVRWPAVPKHQARLRLTVMSTHSDNQIAYLIKCCESIGKKLKILP